MKAISIMLILIIVSCPAMALDIKAQIDSASSEITAFFEGVPSTDFVIIPGSGISAEDKLIFSLLKENVESADTIEIMPDSAGRPSRSLILLGSSKTNIMMKKLDEEGSIVSRKASSYPPVMVEMLVLDNGKKALCIYSQKEDGLLQNNAPARSPLGLFLDKKQVAVAATMISLLLLFLLHILMNAGSGIFTEFSSSKIMQKISGKKQARKKEITHVHKYLHKGEVIALLTTILVFSAMMTWSWAPSSGDFPKYMLLNLGIVGLITISRELYRVFMCYRHRISSEVFLWPAGTGLTVISTFLGNTFSLASYTLVEEGACEKRLGKITFMLSLITFSLAILLYIIDIFIPSQIFQLTFVYAIMMVFIELFPLSPMPGSDCRKWNKYAWLGLYIAAIAAYVYMNFTTYV
ncbi:MAG: hypothetical protein HGA85_06945 [Nanoarchaeota archaeon]|nr:hypothetical protein [Nanoarchaeota archaeon]